MTTNYKILGQTAPAAATESTNYSVPTGTSTLIKTINIANRSASSDTYSIAIIPSTTPVNTNVFVAAGTLGTRAASSTDGITWTTKTLSTSQTWRSMAYGGGAWVIVPNGASATYSTDGVTWTTTTMPSSKDWWTVKYGNGVFVAVAYVSGGSTASASSTDGITWTARTLPASAYWRGLAYGTSGFVAVGMYTSAAVSTDGITWTLRTLPVSKRWYSAAYGNGVYVAVSNQGGFGASSTNGVTWTQRALPTANVYWQSVTYGNGVFVAVSYYNANISALSTDGITWTLRTMPANGTWAATEFGTAVLAPNTQNSNYIAYTNTVAGNSTVTLDAGYTVASPGAIKVTSTNGTSTFSSFGAEVS